MNGAESLEYEERPGRDPLEYLEIPFRYPRPLLVAFGAVLAVALVLAAVVPRKYRSSTLIIVESKSVPPEYYVTAASAEALSQKLNTIRLVILSRTRLEEVIRRLDPYPESAGEPLHVVVDAMRDAIALGVYGSDSFTISYVNRDPKKAKEVTEMLATQFIEDSDRLRERLTTRAFDLLKANQEAAREALEERERALRRFEQVNWGSLPDQLDSNLRTLEQLQFEQQTLGESLRTLGERRGALERLLQDRELPVVSTPGAAGPRSELGKLRASYESLRGRYTDEHPDMRLLRARMESLERQIAGASQSPASTGSVSFDPEGAALTQNLRKVEGEIESLETRRRHLDERIALLRSRVDKTPRARQGLADLTRDYQQLRDDYTLALKKERDAEMARRLEEYWRSGYFRVLDPAYVPGRPIMPYGTLLVFGGLAAGLGAGLAAAFLADLMDRSVKSERELAELLSCPLLVTIPRAAAPGAGGAAKA